MGTLAGLAIQLELEGRRLGGGGLEEGRTAGGKTICCLPSEEDHRRLELEAGGAEEAGDYRRRSPDEKDLLCRSGPLASLCCGMGMRLGGGGVEE